MCFLLFFLLNLTFPFSPKVDYSKVILSSEGEVLGAYLNQEDKWRMYTPLEEVSVEFQKAILFKEDKYFYYHIGVNPIAVARAFTNNMLSGRTTSGASTITMQVARMLDPKPRTYLNKIIEILRSIQLEWQYSKDEILEMYINLVPYGGNIEGIKAASVLFFGTPPDKLSLAQATVLCIVPNKPTSWALGRSQTALEEARNRWLGIFQENNLFKTKDIQDATVEPLIAYRRNVPKLAPHFCGRIRHMSDTPNIKTNISLKVQDKLNRIAKNYTRRLTYLGIHNASVLVIENSNRNIVGYLGSSNFDDNRHGGQVDGVRALRSPGSTLKPLVYGLAIDKGLATPKSITLDVRKHFDNYTPENFDRKFHGRITVEEALSKSLNIPAVDFLNQIGVEELIASLKKAGFNSIAQQEYKLGLSLALGGCGVKLEELVGLYSTFANLGSYQPLNFLVSDSNKQSLSIPVLSSSSSYMIGDILQQLQRPDLPQEYLNAKNLPTIAWKTGTSYGRKDAWSIGFNKKYTIGVWVGNFDGTGIRELTGSNIATPLLFNIFNTIDYNSSDGWFKMPETLEERLVCSETGKLPEKACEHLISDFFIPKISDTERCKHQSIHFVNTEEQISYCSFCLPDNGYKKKMYPNHSPELLSYFEEQGLPYEKIPEHNPHCKAITGIIAPSIVSPLNNREYLFDEESRELMLQCHTANNVKQVYWYINDRFLQKASPSEKIFFTPPKGKIKISCSDDKGQNTDIFIHVRSI